MADVGIRSGPAGPGLLASLTPLLREWLPRQRWFAGKGRPVTGFTPVCVTELLPAGGRLGLYHLLVRAEQGGGPGDCYQLLIGARETLPPRLAPARIGEVNGRTCYDALYDARPAEVLLEAVRAGARVGPLRFSRSLEVDIPPGLPPRLLTAEQSNSSVVYGDSFVLKVLRRVVPGVNPDLELPLALAREGCERVPAPVGWVGADVEGEGWVLGVLQPYVRGAVDGWELALRGLAGRTAGEKAEPEFPAPYADLCADPFTDPFAPPYPYPYPYPDAFAETFRDDVPEPADTTFCGDARALGRATAEVHLALARALPTATLGHAQLQPLVTGMVARLEAAVQAVPSLRPYQEGLRTAFSALGELAGEGHTWTAQRVHGDLHLGQVLRTPAGRWLLIDFEGEPNRPLPERRMPQPAVRDVAGMLRSFDYAAHSADPPAVKWAASCRAAYCSGYADVTGVDPRTDPVLLRAYETDKAVYEVVYEARHRPDWLPVPLAAIRRLAAPELT